MIKRQSEINKTLAGNVLKELKEFSCTKPVNMEFKFKFYQKTAKAGVIEILITIPITLEHMQQRIIKPYKSSLGTWCQKRSKRFKKLENIFKMLKFVIIKLSETFNYI